MGTPQRKSRLLVEAGGVGTVPPNGGDVNDADRHGLRKKTRKQNISAHKINIPLFNNLEMLILWAPPPSLILFFAVKNQEEPTYLGRK